MSEPARLLATTFAEYVAQERHRSTRHELVNGQVYAMAGGSPEHALIAMNIGAELRSALRGRGCKVFSSDVRIRVRATGLATYPDVSVVCGELARDPEDESTLVNPVLLVEVLSPSTEAYDRGEKFAHYRRLPSLREVVLVSQSRRRVELFRRNDDGSWTLYEADGSGALDLASVGCKLALDEVYLGVFAEDTAPAAR
ncbi:Uma2 family endonuclease [Chondromyces crocatus]|uniref:Putative restriction endonuclease domain-containing protein n=1 Tax=Chondromyces crocatus TaxID=52 RepID=A0A0K1ELH2_CHOCO|nr:Uma2 family endonuclease [Chondromyces crocatus]AKT41730.1 uncharacterized protein CMC5_059410 [Chondromyces crocatus]